MSSVMVLQCLFIYRGKRACITDEKVDCRVFNSCFFNSSCCSKRALPTGEELNVIL